MTTFTQQELYDKVQVAKSFLNKEIVKMRLGTVENPNFSSQEIYHKLDLIREAERLGFRHLDSRLFRKLEKMVVEIDTTLSTASMN